MVVRVERSAAVEKPERPGVPGRGDCPEARRGEDRPPVDGKLVPDVGGHQVVLERAERERPDQCDEEGGDAGDQHQARDECGVRPFFQAGGEGDDADEREQADRERGRRAEVVVDGDRRGVGNEEVGRDDSRDRRETGDDAERRRGRLLVHTRCIDRPREKHDEPRRPPAAISVVRIARSRVRHPNTRPNYFARRRVRMGLGSTAKKLQRVADVAEELFKQVKDLRQRMTRLEDDLTTTRERVDDLSDEQRRQRALLEAVADAQGVAVDDVLEAVDEEIEAERETAAEADAADDAAEQPAE